MNITHQKSNKDRDFLDYQGITLQKTRENVYQRTLFNFTLTVTQASEDEGGWWEAKVVSRNSMGFAVREGDPEKALRLLNLTTSYFLDRLFQRFRQSKSEWEGLFLLALRENEDCSAVTRNAVDY